jgi:Fur family ferric uptake transcriptional regulator
MIRIVDFQQESIVNKVIEDKLQSRNIKPTAMRQLVLQVLSEQTTAISLPELEQKFERADKATLYRTLKTFEKRKLIHSFDDGTGPIKYALCLEECTCSIEDLHVHFHCTKCDQTYCLNDIPIPSINLPKDFLLENVNMVVQGVCSNCKI